MRKEDFLKDVSGWNNHLPLLWLALEETKGSIKPVVEYGSGQGSTPYLREYCQYNNRPFFSYDNNREWAEQMNSVLVTDWTSADIYKPCSVCLVDCAPGEVRHEIMAIMKDRADIVVVHDSEPKAIGYMLDKIWPLYNYRVNLIGESVQASAVSNSIDLSKFEGQIFGQYKVARENTSNNQDMQKR